MTLQGKIEEDYLKAMKKKDETQISTLRLLKSALINREIQKKETLKEEEIITIIQSEIKSRNEAIKLYVKGNRPELAAKEEKEITLLKVYLPEQMSEEDLRKQIAAIIQKTNAQDIKEMGKVMEEATNVLKGKAEMSRVSQIVKESLSKNEN